MASGYAEQGENAHRMTLVRRSDANGDSGVSGTNRRLYSKEMCTILKENHRLRAADKCHEVIMQI